MEYRHGMVSWLGKVMEHTDLTTGLDRSGDDRVVKQLPVYHLGAGKCEQNSSCPDGAHSLNVKALVSAHSLVARIPVFREGRRVENNDVVFALLIL